MSGLRIRWAVTAALIVLMVTGGWVLSALAAGGKHSAPVEQPRPIVFIKDGETRSVSLDDVYEFCGNTCLSATTGFLAARYGLDLLYGDEIPDLDDIVVVSKTGGGPVDVFDLIMKGGDRSQRTWPPAGIASGRDNFSFHLYRKPTMQGVIVNFRPESWPEGWTCKDPEEGTVSDAKLKEIRETRQRILQDYPMVSAEALFGTPEVYTFVTWGHVEQGEMDRLIREQRRQSRGQQAKQ